MPILDFASMPDENYPSECIYTLITSNKNTISPERSILPPDNRSRKWNHHSNGMFTNPVKQTSFGFQEEGGTFSAGILQADARFISLLQWLGEDHIRVRLPGQNREDGYTAYKIRELAFRRGARPFVENGFLQLMVDRLFASSAPEPEQEEEEPDELGDHMKLTSLQSISDSMACTGRAMSDNVRPRAKGNLAVARSHEVSPEGKRHTQRILFVMVNIQWESNYFESIDPVEARQILNEGPCGMEQMKQRIIKTIIQINRTHTLLAYGLLLADPTGTGKSQIAYTVARILKLPWATLDMSSISDPEQLTGSSRIYADTKPGIIIETFSMAGESNLAFIINGLDKVATGKGNDNSTDVLLTLLGNLGLTNNYIGCMIPTASIYPVTTTNDKSKISAPLMSHFTAINTPDYTPEEKKATFSNYALSKVLTRMGMRRQECIIIEDGLETLVDQYHDTSGIRDLEQAAEYIVANALYQIEVNHVDHIVFDAGMVRKLLG